MSEFVRLENWEDYIRPETVIVIDDDSFTYHAAAASQKDEVKIINNITGEEILEEYIKKEPIYDVDGEVVGEDEIPSTRRFKNKTAFYGMGKKVISNYLANMNAEREANGEEPYTKEDFTIEKVTTPLARGIAIRNLESSVNSLRKLTGVDKVVRCIAAEVDTNFRLDLPLPVKYKSCRDHLERPVNLKFLKQYAREYLGSKVIDGMEVDDVIQMYATKAYATFKKEGWIPYLVFTEDKDNLSTISSAIIWNPRKVEGKFVYTSPFLVEGLGEIWEGKNNTIKGYGFKHLCYQMLFGDPNTDGFSPTKGFGKRFGVKSILSALEDCETGKDCIKAVDEVYDTWFPEGYVEFKDYKGLKGALADEDMRDVKLSVEEWKEVIFQCLYMKRSFNDKTTWKSLSKKLGA